MPAPTRFTIAQQQLDAAASKLGFDSATHQPLRWLQREPSVTFRVRLDDGVM